VTVLSLLLKFAVYRRVFGSHLQLVDSPIKSLFTTQRISNCSIDHVMLTNRAFPVRLTYLLLHFVKYLLLRNESWLLLITIFLVHLIFSYKVVVSDPDRFRRGHQTFLAGAGRDV